MLDVIRHVHHNMSDDALESERKLFSHAITFYCLRVYNAHIILDTMSEQDLWEKLRGIVVALRNNDVNFRHPLTRDYLLRIYDTLADAIMFVNNPFTGTVVSMKTGKEVVTTS